MAATNVPNFLTPANDAPAVGRFLEYKRVAGHSSVLISQCYVHPSPEAIENAMGRLEAYNASKAVAERVQ
jgi:hypothetical protein